MNVHDHFDGSAHCLECSGRCTLAGDELAATELIRFLLEYFESAHLGWMQKSLRDSVEALVGESRFRNLQKRAKETAYHHYGECRRKEQP